MKRITKTMENTYKSNFKIGDIVKVSPELTNLDEWVEGKIIKMWQNPFLGLEVAIEDNLGRIFFGEEIFFKSLKGENICTQ